MFGKFAFNSLIVLLFSFFALSVFAQEADKKSEKKAKGNQQGIVISHEAAVYAKPDFDSELVGSVKEHQKLTMSTRKFSGGDFGNFFRVRLPNGRIGYIADNDIQPAKLKKKYDDEMEESQESESLYFKKMVGASIASVNYSEVFQGKTSKAQTTMFGFRLTGPDILGDSPPLDMNILVGIKPPAYYDTMSSGKATGFFLLGDIGLMFPLIDWDKAILNFGIGAMWTYTNFKVPIANKTYASDELRLGLDLSFGGAYKIDQYVVRGDLKYFIEKTQYTALFLSLQKIY